MVQSLCHLSGVSQASMVQLIQAKFRLLLVVPLAFQDLAGLALRPPCPGLRGPPFPQLTAAAPEARVYCLCLQTFGRAGLPAQQASSTPLPSWPTTTESPVGPMTLRHFFLPCPCPSGHLPSTYCPPLRGCGLLAGSASLLSRIYTISSSSKSQRAPSDCFLELSLSHYIFCSCFPPQCQGALISTSE